MLTLRLADGNDEAGLRRLLWDTPMRGIVDLVFAREPDFNALGKTQGDSVQTIIACDSDRVVGLATRAIRKTRINGEVVDSGYLADFRLHPDFRGGLILMKGYRLFLDLHTDGKASIYSAMVVEDNEQAMKTLLSGRAGLPQCLDLGRVFTPLILVNRNRVIGQGLERGSVDTIPEIVAALNRNERQFAPVYGIDDFVNGRYPDFSIDDLFILRRGGEIVAVAGLWIQTSMRQTIALQYSGIKKYLRPVVNRMFGLGLPGPGEPFKIAYVAFVHAEDDADYELLIRECIAVARTRGITHLVAGMHERDTRSQVLKQFTAIPFAGRMFAIQVEGELSLDSRVPYMEPATL